MKLKKAILMSIEGSQQAIQMGLNREGNWTPLLIYLHTSRILFGAILGILIGFGIGVGLSFVFLKGGWGF